MATAVRFFSVLFTGLALIALAAHLFVLPNKIGLPKSDYFIVQGIYRGWWIVGLLLPLALLANLLHAFVARNDRFGFMLSLMAAACIAINLIIFYFFTQPANAATGNWIVQPDNWEALRTQWEYSHAANAGVMLMAFCFAIVAGMQPGDR